MSKLPAPPQRQKKLRRRLEAMLKAEPNRTWHFTSLLAELEADKDDLAAVCNDLYAEGKMFHPHPSRRGHTRVKKAGGL